MRQLKMELVRSVSLYVDKASAAIKKGWRTAAYVVANDISFSGGALSTRQKNAGYIAVRDLILD